MDVEVDDLERKYSAMITSLLRPLQNAAPFYDLSHTRMVKKRMRLRRRRG